MKINYYLRNNSVSASILTNPATVTDELAGPRKVVRPANPPHLSGNSSTHLPIDWFIVDETYYLISHPLQNYTGGR